MKSAAGILAMAMLLWLTGQVLAGLSITRFPAPIMLLVAFTVVLPLSSRLRRWLEPGARFLIRYLQLFFVPALVGALALGDVIRGAWLPLVFAVVVSTCFGVVAAGLCYRLVIRLKGQENRL